MIVKAPSLKGSKLYNYVAESKVMNTTLENLHNDLREVKRDLAFIKYVLREEYEISDTARSSLKDARNTPTEDYIDVDEL